MKSTQFVNVNDLISRQTFKYTHEVKSLVECEKEAEKIWLKLETGKEKKV